MLNGFSLFRKVLLFLTFVLVMNQSGYSALNRSHYLVILAIIIFILTGILLILYLFNVPDKHKNIPWKYIELAYCLFSTLLLGIFSLYLVMYEYNTKLLIVGGVSIAKHFLVAAYCVVYQAAIFDILLQSFAFQCFGLMATCAYGVDFILKLMQSGLIGGHA